LAVPDNAKQNMLKNPKTSVLRNLMITMVISFLAICFITALKNNELVYEWEDIMGHLIESGEYKYMDNYSAFMPPLYPYYLLFVYKIFNPFTAGTMWLVIANFLQAVLFVGAVYFAFRTFFFGQLSLRLLLFFAAIIFFPPVLLSLTKVSSFALAVSLSMFFLSFWYRFAVLKQRNMIVWFVVVLCLAMYIRFEFGLYFILLSCFLPVFTKKWYWNLTIALVVFCLVYSPWILRNHNKIDLAAYSTSFQYNFSKGNNIQYDLFSSYNMPYDEERNLRLENEYFDGVYASEKEKELYLQSVNKYYLNRHFEHFVTNSFKKVGINFLQYFPDYNLFPRPVFAILYSLFFVSLFVVVLVASAKKIFFSLSRKKDFLSIFIFVSFWFMLFFYSVAPLPRYALFFYPFFVIYLFSVHTNYKSRVV